MKSISLSSSYHCKTVSIIWLLIFAFQLSSFWCLLSPEHLLMFGLHFVCITTCCTVSYELHFHSLTQLQWVGSQIGSLRILTSLIMPSEMRWIRYSIQCLEFLVLLLSLHTAYQCLPDLSSRWWYAILLYW